MNTFFSKRLIIIALIIPFLFGCAKQLRPYKLDIAQGNDITHEMVNKLQIGMTKHQVQYILGTPLIQDYFHKERWDYFYSYKPAYKKITRRHMSLYFENDKLARIKKN